MMPNYINNQYQRNLSIGRIGFNAVTINEMIHLIEHMPVDTQSGYVTFTGVPIIVASEKSWPVANAQNQATICACDGMPVKWIARKQGILCDRCSGPDIMQHILRNGLSSHRRHFFYGSTDEVLTALKSNLTSQFPGIEIVGMYAPPFRELTSEEEKTVIHSINSVSPDYVWVGLGAPKQDLWMQKHRTVLKNCRLLGVGAAFNFLSGTVKRAPVTWQKLGLEWFYRFLQEPGHLWKRYLLGGPHFALICLRDFRKRTHNDERSQ